MRSGFTLHLAPELGLLVYPLLSLSVCTTVAANPGLSVLLEAGFSPSSLPAGSWGQLQHVLGLANE